VVSYHYFALPAKAAGIHAVPFLFVLADHGWIGVNLFFVLSGYLITRGLAGRPAGLATLRGFWVKRAMRIVPAYALLLLSFSAARALWPASAPDAARVFNTAVPLWSYLAFAQNFYIARIGYLGNDWLRVLWSLAVEMQFYLFISVALVLIPPARAARSLALFAAAAVAFRFAIYLTGENADAALVVLLPSRLDAFLLGGLLSLAPAGAGGAARTGAALGVAAGAAAFMAVLYRGGFRSLSLYMVPLYYTVISVGCAALLDLCARPVRAVALILGSRPLAEAGRLSYFIYLFHMPVALAVFHFGLGAAPSLGGRLGAAAMAASFAGVWALAWLSFEYFEGPLIGWSHSLAGRARPGAAAAPAG
jgi:peptidoglycan/LPS O-acetylase OafA/YrhL